MSKTPNSLPLSEDMAVYIDAASQDLEAFSPGRIGFKAHNLWRMARAGLPVPPAFVVTTEACRAFRQIEAQHHEVATAGQAEIDLRFGPLVKMADNTLKYKYVIKNTARKHNKTVTVFKDGHAFVLHQGQMPVDPSGNVLMDYLPTPVLGTFWPFSADKDARLTATTAGQRRVTVQRSPLTIRELIEANVGAAVTITETTDRPRGEAQSRVQAQVQGGVLPCPAHRQPAGHPERDSPIRG